MTDKELKKLSRIELLEILIELSNENAELTKKVEELSNQLESRDIMLNEAGSIAEASIKINEVFEAAQSAASQYVENIKRLSESQSELCVAAENESRQKAEVILQQTEHECKKRLKETELECKRRLKETELKCAKMTQEANEKCQKSKQEAEDYRKYVSQKIFELCREHEFLRNILNSNMRNNSYDNNNSGTNAKKTRA